MYSEQYRMRKIINLHYFMYWLNQLHTVWCSYQAKMKNGAPYYQWSTLLPLVRPIATVSPYLPLHIGAKT